MRGAVFLLPLLLLAGCDNMSRQQKELPYATEATAPGPIPAGTVQYEAAPTPAPPLSLALIQRGQDRFRIFCTPCHSELGDGDGWIVHRGFAHPPNYTSPKLMKADTRLFYNVITHGYGAMYSFAQRVPPDDRWAIAAYIRALQLSQHAHLSDLTPAQRKQLQ